MSLARQVSSFDRIPLQVARSNIDLMIGLVVTQRNFLDVYIYDKWQSRKVPEFEEAEEFMPTVCELRDGATTKPSLLTDADLVTLMDKNGIGEHDL
jgi:DNA topoisomerase IA